MQLGLPGVQVEPGHQMAMRDQLREHRLVPIFIDPVSTNIVTTTTTYYSYCCWSNTVVLLPLLLLLVPLLLLLLLVPLLLLLVLVPLLLLLVLVPPLSNTTSVIVATMNSTAMAAVMCNNSCKGIATSSLQSTTNQTACYCLHYRCYRYLHALLSDEAREVLWWLL